MQVARIDVYTTKVNSRTVLECEGTLLRLRCGGFEFHMEDMRRGHRLIRIETISIEHIVMLRSRELDLIVKHRSLAEELGPRRLVRIFLAFIIERVPP